MINRIRTIQDTVLSEQYGNKAYWLSWLYQFGCNVPFAIFIPAFQDQVSKQLQGSDEFLQMLSFFQKETIYDVAIRSSSTTEDGEISSKAGHYKSFIDRMSYDDIFLCIEKVIQSKDPDDSFSGMGVIIQKKISSHISGVIFSSNFINGSKSECIVSMIHGMGERLVSGECSGKDFIISLEDRIPDLSIVDFDINQQVLVELIQIAKDIEEELQYPVDIEWCINSEDELYILQCRPITALLNKYPSQIFALTHKKKDLIPTEVIDHEKVQLRLFAQKNNIKISNAYIVIVPHVKSLLDVNVIQPESFCTGFSIVSLYPTRINGKILRKFAKKEFSKQQILYRPCQRYDIRTYEDSSSIEANLHSIIDSTFQNYWLSILIVQEIFNPEYTGIIQKSEEGYLIEIGKGHFIPKGLVPTSQYILNQNGNVIQKNEVIQPKYYDLIAGQIEEIQYQQLVSVSKTILRELLENLKPTLDNQKLAIEFGILQSNDGAIPYLIDLVEDKSQVQVSKKMLKDGVISSGKCIGTLQKYTMFDNTSLHKHFHDTQQNTEYCHREKIIFFHSTPDIALLEILHRYDNQHIGFIFESGSLLSHFSILLRERNIPAIVGNFDDFNTGDLIEIDCIRDLPKEERIRRLKGYVTSYINPDSDGVCAAIAYNYMNKNITPVVFGQLDEETLYILENYKVNLPSFHPKFNVNDKIILVDTHHQNQIHDSILTENVIEIIDHHPSDSSSNFPNAIIKNEKVGAVCTLIVERMKQYSLEPTYKIAGILSSAIISNTLHFKGPSTTDRDKEAYSWLQNYCRTDNSYIREMFSARSNILHRNFDEILDANTKYFLFDKYRLGICQIELINMQNLILKDEIFKKIRQLIHHKSLQGFILTVVDIDSEITKIWVSNSEIESLLSDKLDCSFDNNIGMVNKILLRKTHYVPIFQNRYHHTNSK